MNNNLNKEHKNAERRPSDIDTIPEDWEVKKLGEIFDFKNGLNKEKQYFGYGTPIVNYVDVYKNRGLYSSEILGKVDVNKQELKAYEVQKGDVFFTRTSETVSEIGLSTVILDVVEQTIFSGFVLRGRPKSNDLDTLFKKYCFSSNQVRIEITSKSSYTTRALTNGKLLSSVQIPLPPLPEQKRIAAALSDMDSLLNNLEELIAKKRSLKQGVMQELLKPKKGWVVKKLGDCLLKSPDYGINAASVPYSENLPVYLRITDISEDGKFVSKQKTSVDNLNSENYVLSNDEIVFARTGASVGKTYLYNPHDGKLIFAGFLIRVKVNTKVLDSRFLKGILETKEYWNWVTVMSMRSGQPGINGIEYSQFQFSFPPLSEQESIAKILSEIDLEIEVLEGKRAKYQQMKTGMMQELLTGRVRLV